MRLFGVLVVAVLLAVSLVMPAAAASEEAVTGTVTVATPCITVGESLDFGSLRFSRPGESATAAFDNTSYTNCSSGGEDIYVHGTKATSSTSAAEWNLTGTIVCNVGPNYYRLGVGDSNSGVNLSTSAQLLGANVAGGATDAVSVEINMPCSGSDGAGETMTFQVVFTASF
jgi:hypothetical protein